MTVRVLVVGAGAIGSVLGARLHRAGVETTLVARPAHVAAIRERGLTVEGLDGGPFPLPAVDEVPSGELYDRVLLTVKAGDIAPAGAAIARGLAHPAPVLALENGLGIAGEVRTALKGAGWSYTTRWVTRGILIGGATLLGPGRVRIAGAGEVLLGAGGRFGGLNGFDALLARAGVAVRRVESIEREEWRKVIVNAGINPVSADHGIENGRLAEEPWRGQALALLEEARRVAEREGFPFTPEEMEREFARIVRESARNRSSMLQDLDAGRPTEIGAISGALLALGERHGLEMPATRRALERITEKARAGARARRPATG